MAYKFYIALKNKTPSVHVTWEECKNLRREGGTYVKGFNDVLSAMRWAGKHGVLLKEEEIPPYAVQCEPVLEEPAVIPHNRPIVDNNTIRIFTDGSCLSNPGGPGGFSSVSLLPDGSEIVLSGRELSTTSNRMELMAALSVLNYLDSRAKTEDITAVYIHTDSRYLRDIFEKGWIQHWTLNGWKTMSGKDVQNKDLLEILDWLVDKLKVRFSWVKGHNGNRFNEKADKIASEQANKAAEECGFNMPAAEKKFFPAPKKRVDNNTGKAKDTGLPSLNQPKKAEVAAPNEPVSVKAEENSVLPFKASYRTVPIGRQKKKNKQKLNANGNGMHKATLKIELRNGSILSLPVSYKQVEAISFILGIEAQEGSAVVKVFDDLTLERIFSMQANPLPILAKACSKSQKIK